HLMMAGNLEDESQRTALATAYVQRLLDIQASHRAAVLGGTHEAYYWEATTIFAGVLLADTRMRGFHWYGEAGPRGDYDTWTSDGDPKYFTWDQMAGGMGRLPDPKTFAEDMSADRDAEGWAALLRERTVEYAGPAFDGSHAGIVDNGDGTWTIPANRFAYGGLTARGTVPVLDPRGGWHNVLVPSAAWADRANLPHKIWSYRQQHNPKTANLALMLKAVGLIDYHTLSDVYANEAYEFMLFPEAWYQACGFPERGPTDPWGYQVACPGARSDAHGYAVFGSWLNDAWMARWRDAKPHVRPGPPGACRTEMFRLHDRGNGSEVEVQLVDLPDDHFSRITDFELSINGGPWTSMETNQVRGVYVVADLPAGVPATFRLRAVNAHGPGAPSLGKRITPVKPAGAGAGRHSVLRHADYDED
ncbi:MAG: fibronectin type III domain-containing protein, partial [Thermoguttaceae bacterium]